MPEQDQSKPGSDGLPAAMHGLGDHPALDFLNTTLEPIGVPLDFLADGQRFRDWLTWSAVLPEPTRAELAGWSRSPLDALAVDARALREALRQLLIGRAAGTPPDQRALALINQPLAAHPQVVRLAHDGQAFQLQSERPTGAVLAELAALCALLLAEVPVAQVRHCENPACVIWFNDAKRGPRRRWCSMSLCGNRAKAAAHRARQRLPD